MSQESQADDPRRAFYSVQQIAERHPAFTERTIRHWIFFAKERLCWCKGKRTVIPGNGFAKALVKQGRRVYIDESAMVEWLQSFGLRDGTNGGRFS
jgi:hypothetical protein